MPYEEIQPGDRVAAEPVNSMQTKIKADIQNQVEAAKQEIRTGGVERADKADRFGDLTPEEWEEHMDDKYAPKEHYHEAWPRRYFLDMDVLLAGPPNELQPAVLIHDMGCHPIVQVYELQALPIASNELTRDYKFCWSGPPHAVDPEAVNFVTRSWDEREWGVEPGKIIAQMAHGLNEKEQQELMSNFRDTRTLNVWLTSVERLLFEPGPSPYHFERGDVHRTAWVKNREDRVVAELKDQGEWPPMFVYRPRLVNAMLFTYGGDEAVPVNIDIFHLNLNEVEIGPQTDRETHLMVLLKA